MRKIYKYEVYGQGIPTEITCKAKTILDIQLQGAEMVCWVEVDDDFPEVTIKLISIGTGWDIPSELLDSAVYVKTVQDAAGFVWHFYRGI